MTISTNQLMTGAAVALGAFAVWFVFRGPGRAAMAPTAEQKRSASMGTWFGGITGQASYMYQESLMESGAVLRALGVTP